MQTGPDCGEVYYPGYQHAFAPLGSSILLGTESPKAMMMGLAHALMDMDVIQGRRPIMAGRAGGDSDRPQSKPTSSMSMTREDGPIQVQIDFRARPLCDGGGKPALGRCPPRRRGQSPFASLEQELKPFLAYCFEVPALAHKKPSNRSGAYSAR